MILSTSLRNAIPLFDFVLTMRELVVPPSHSVPSCWWNGVAFQVVGTESRVFGENLKRKAASQFHKLGGIEDKFHSLYRKGKSSSWAFSQIQLFRESCRKDIGTNMTQLEIDLLCIKSTI